MRCNMNYADSSVFTPAGGVGMCRHNDGRSIDVKWRLARCPFLSAPAIRECQGMACPGIAAPGVSDRCREALNPHSAGPFEYSPDLFVVRAARETRNSEAAPVA